MGSAFNEYQTKFSLMYKKKYDFQLPDDQSVSKYINLIPPLQKLYSMSIKWFPLLYRELTKEAKLTRLLGHPL